MTMKRQNLITTKISDLRFPIAGSNVDVPKVAVIVDASNKFAYIDGEQTDTVTKISLSLIDEKTVVVAKQAGLDMSSLPTFAAEIQGTDAVAQLKDHADKLIDQKIPTESASLALRWIGFGDRGRWGGLKLIFDHFQSTSPSIK